MFFTEQKLRGRINELEGYRYRDRQSLTDLRYCEDTQKEPGAYPPRNNTWESCGIGQRWQGRDRYIWLEMDAAIPEAWRQRRVLGRFDFGRTGPGNNSRFESLLFVNSRPYQGVDSNHREVFFEPSAIGETIRLQARLWSGLEGGGPPQDLDMQLRQAEICWLDEAVDDLYYTALAMWETIQVLPENRPERQELLKILNGGFLELDWTAPGGSRFYGSVEAARQYIHSRLGGLPKHHDVTVTAIGHTHIDVAWLWRLCHTREKCARSFATVLRLMELFPEYVFLQTQPQLYQYVKRDYPELYQEMKERIAEGRWEADGAMWVEADCNVISGESLVRQILHGKRYLQKEFGVNCRYLWLPDVFGYSWALPQVLKRSGIDTFMTTKISWNQYNRMPHDTFWWQGIDGTEILTHFITTPDQGAAQFYTYNGSTNARFVQGIWDNYRDKNVNKELLLAYGYGDGGGGVNRDMLEMRRRLETMPGIPAVQPGRAGEYFQRLHDTVAETQEYVHKWNGELYLEYHRGTYTSQAAVKRGNRKLELELRRQEWLDVLRAAQAHDWELYPQKPLYKAWQTVLLHQFHDIIPGSSIREVYEDTLEDYAGVRDQLQELQADVLRSLVTEDDPFTYTVFNSGSFLRQGLVDVPLRAGMEEGTWQDQEGNVLRAAADGDSWSVLVYNVPSLGYTTISFVPGNRISEERPFTVHSRGVDTPFYSVAWDANGQLTQIYDRKFERDVLAPGERGNVLQVFEDKPMAHDAWDIDLFYQEKMEEIRRLISAELVEHNALRCIMRFRWQWDASTIEQDMVLYSSTRRIDFRTKVDWHQRQQLLKVAFPVDIHASEATYDIQFGNVKRPTHWNTSWDWARFETVGHQWADLSEEGYGVSLLNDCKYGYDIKDNVLRLSLIKSAIHPDYEADQGEHTFTYSLLAHEGSWLQGDTVVQAWKLNQPLLAVSGRTEPRQFSTVGVEGGHVLIDSVKKAEDGPEMIVRFHEYGGARGKVTLTSDLPVAQWQECNLMEEPEGPISHGPMTLLVKPYEVRTLRIWLA